MTLFPKWACLHEARHNKENAHLVSDSAPLSQPPRRTALSQLLRASTMKAGSDDLAGIREQSPR